MMHILPNKGFFGAFTKHSKGYLKALLQNRNPQLFAAALLLSTHLFAGDAIPQPATPNTVYTPGFDVPLDKKLSPGGLSALSARGEPEVYQGKQLSSLSMPIGGLFTGFMTLSGDGRLSNWQLAELFLEGEQGFAIRTTTGGKSAVHQLNRFDFPEMTFRGEYPIAKLNYKSDKVPVQTSLEVFSPFIPLNADESGLPATIFNFTIKNTSDIPVEVTLAGGLKNEALGCSRFSAVGERRNTIVSKPGLTILDCGVALSGIPKASLGRPDILFEDWNKDTYEGWATEGTAFGAGPKARDVVERVNWPLKFNGAGGHSAVTKGDKTETGKLVSSSFTISRNYINFWLASGDTGKPWVKLVIKDGPELTQTGIRDADYFLRAFDVREFQGKQARLEFMAEGSRALGIGRIAFSDVPGDGQTVTQWLDYGSMAMALLGAPAELRMANGSIGFTGQVSDDASVPLSSPLIGTLGRTVKLEPGASASVTFIVTWHFPNFEMRKLGSVGNWYATKYSSARAVADYVAANFERLSVTTRLWRDTWYDSTLPYWFLDRTFANSSSLATSACTRFGNGRFYGYEGGPGPSFPGTCTHVWHYAQSMARLFPGIERDTRERVDLGIGFMPAKGIIGYRAEYMMQLAVDGQAGTILRFYREHQMSPDSGFLTRNWEKIKLTFSPLFALDPKEEGILDGPQNNTLDCNWYGQNSWMSSLYVAALRAGEAMANEMGDRAFAERCARIAANGSRNMVERLYNGEYFNSRIDPAHADAMNSGNGSFIDQVQGQSWAFQLGLPRILPEKESISALRALWKYNFIPDVGGYACEHRPGRIFVSRGDAGMVMCTFPPGSNWDYEKASGGKDSKDYSHRFANYFNETWTGQEYQVASQMMWEGMPLEGLAMVRAIHDRYSPPKRNPWAEQEAGWHYVRAMASYGAFIGACGFEYNGPQGHIGFAPRLTPENFRAAFVGAEGWGSFAQSISERAMHAGITMKYGQLKLQTLDLALSKAPKNASVRAHVGKDKVPTESMITGDGLVKIRFPSGVTVPAGQELAIDLGW